MKQALLFVLLLAVSGTSYADGTEKNWEERKTKKLERLGERISMLQEAKSCIEAASTKEAFKACNKSMKSKRKAQRGKAKKS